MYKLLFEGKKEITQNKLGYLIIFIRIPSNKNKLEGKESFKIV